VEILSMSEFKVIRELVGDYYSSLYDYKQDLHAKLTGKKLLIHLPIKDTFNPLPKKVLAAFYHSIGHLQVMDRKYQHFYFDKYQAFNRFYLLSPGDEIEVSFLTAKGHLVGTNRFSINPSLIARMGHLPRESKNKAFIIQIIKKQSLVEPNYAQQAQSAQTSLKRSLLDLIKYAQEAKTSKQRRIRLGRTNNGDISKNIIIFFKSLKIDLKLEDSLETWQSQLDHSQINWGFKDVEELKTLSALLQNYENQADLMQGKIGLSTLFKRVAAQQESTTQDYQTMLQLIKELSV
jgi:hypothetical protein